MNLITMILLNCILSMIISFTVSYLFLKFSIEKIDKITCDFLQEVKTISTDK